MPDYIYTARTLDGKLHKNRSHAKDEKDLANILKDQNLILTSTKIIKRGGISNLDDLMNKFRRVPIVQKIFFSQNLSIMVKTGFSLASALATLAAQTTNKKFKGIIENIQHDVESGISFSNSLTKYPTVFSEIYVNMISAGEASGKLDEILVTLTSQMKKDHALIAKVRSAMMYPSVVVTAMVGIGAVMMITVVPQMMGIYSEAGTQLPLPTRLLMAVSNGLIHYGIFIVVALAVSTFGLLRWRKTKQGKKIIHKILLRLPIFGNILKKINLARFTRTLSSLLKTDIPIVQTLQIIAKTLGNFYYSEAMLKASEQVKKGISISKTLAEQSILFPPIITQMINVGEESGTLDTISEQVANFYEEDVDQTMSGLSTIIEPVLMLVIGAVVAVMALAVLMPMYGLVQTI